MKKTLSVKLEKYNSRFFPVKAIWKQGSVLYSAVYETEEQARRYFEQRYFPVKIRFYENF